MQYLGFIPSHAHGSFLLLENLSPRQSAQVFPPQKRGVREFSIEAEQLLGRVSIETIKGTGGETSQITFKLLSNLKMLVVRCVYLAWMLFILKQWQDFQVQMFSRMPTERAG